jgi:hypothetical protein
MDKFYMADSFDRGTGLAYCTKSIAKCSVSTDSVTEELRRLQKEFEEFKKSMDKVEIKKGLRGELKTLRVRVRESEL